MSVLSQHVDQPGDPTRRHRCVLLDERRLRCHDCQRTLMLPTVAGSTSTSRSPIPGPGEPRCPQHQTEHAGTCRTCAADLKAATDLDPGGRHILDRQPTADVTSRAAEARAHLEAAGIGRQPAPRSTTYDPERLAQARAELAAHQPIPSP
jgi:hypothetical protein